VSTGNVENVIVINHNPNESHYLPQKHKKTTKTMQTRPKDYK